jgi:hypothetical protein
MDESAGTTAQQSSAWRFRFGMIVFAVGFLTPLLIPVIAATDHSTKWKVTISGLLSVGIPELFSIVAIALMGKSGFNYLKTHIFIFLKSHAPPDRVSPTRYHIGFVMFVLPLLFGWFAPYVPDLVPGYGLQSFWIIIAGDLMLASSLVVLGGDFWDKLQLLFIHSAKVLIRLLKGYYL